MKIRNVLIAASTSFMVLTGQMAHAEPGRWTGGYGQGIWEANVGNAGGRTLYVACPDAGLGRSSNVTLDVPGLTGGQNSSSQGLFIVDGRRIPWRFDWRVLDQGQVTINADAANGDFRALVRALRRGRTVVVSAPDWNVREDFVLTGSGAALSSCVN